MELTGKLQDIINQSIFLLPELILLCGAVILLLTDMIIRNNKSAVFSWIFIVVLLICGATAVIQHLPFNKLQPVYIWDVLVLDVSSVFFLLLFLMAGILYALSEWSRSGALDLFLAISMLFGAAIVVKTVNLMVLLLGIEILSITAYAFTAKQAGPASKEAGLKYIIFGAVSTAIFLFGVSLLYGLTGSLDISSEGFTSQLIGQDTIFLLIVFIFVLAGLFFKLTAFPFHLWAPDVYQVVPAPLAAFLSIVPKLAVVGFLIKFAMVINLFGIVEVPWKPLIGGVAIVTMTVGNLAALAQTNPQRMLAYSSVAHTGFFLTGIVAFNMLAFHSLLFYGAVYLFMNFLAFLLLYFYQLKYKVTDIRDFNGKMRFSPVHGVLMVVVMIALTGLPPTAGFTAKFLIFSSVWQAYQETSYNFLWVLLIAGVLNTILSLFYYLRIPYYLIFKPTETAQEVREMPVLILNFLFIILVLPLLILFIWPDLLMDWINIVNFAL